MGRTYEDGRWAIYKNLTSTEVLGYFEDGSGLPALPGQTPFHILDNVLYDPSDKRLGYLAPVADYWVVNLGDHDIGHVLRRLEATSECLDTEIFSFMLASSRKHCLWIKVASIQAYLREVLGRAVDVDEIERAINATQYTQRDVHGRRTNILPYQTNFLDGKLNQLSLYDAVVADPGLWGW